MWCAEVIGHDTTRSQPYAPGTLKEGPNKADLGLILGGRVYCLGYILGSINNQRCIFLGRQWSFQVRAPDSIPSIMGTDVIESIQTKKGPSILKRHALILGGSQLFRLVFRP